MRPQTITRKNALFAGGHGGGRTWATIATRAPGSRNSNGSRRAGRSIRSMLSCLGASKPERPHLGAYIGSELAKAAAARRNLRHVGLSDYAEIRRKKIPPIAQRELLKTRPTPRRIRLQ
ncbi:hypothetical protein H1B27_30945 [Bradyrhizobium sp. CNPSo 4019]|uniref:Uncharacterized protein n=1 Tax=Bradyrhizobium diversitatis TaxID=2755406 RepID=A0ABS0PBJ8_9BRAD|nr:hypothetical protein [Bradyrhizobium diversitatis]